MVDRYTAMNNEILIREACLPHPSITEIPVSAATWKDRTSSTCSTLCSCLRGMTCTKISTTVSPALASCRSCWRRQVGRPFSAFLLFFFSPALQCWPSGMHPPGQVVILLFFRLYFVAQAMHVGQTMPALREQSNNPVENEQSSYEASVLSTCVTRPWHMAGWAE